MTSWSIASSAPPFSCRRHRTTRHWRPIFGTTWSSTAQWRSPCRTLNMAPCRYISAPTDRSLSSARARWAVLAAFLLFWGLGLWNLDRYPPIHFDEATILEPGYQLFYNG